MALTCARCRSDLVQALAGDTFQCAACGAHFNSQGAKVSTSNDKDEIQTETGPPPANDPTGIYDHTGPHPTPVYATPPHPDLEHGLQADIDSGEAVGEPQVDPVVESVAKPEKKAKK